MRRPGKKLRTWRRRKRRRMSCGASAIRYLLWALGMGGSVLLLFIKCHARQKAGSPVGFFLPVVGALDAAL